MTDTNDLVERLRVGAYYVADKELTDEAADRIEELEAENKTLKNRIQILERDDTDWTIAVRNQAGKSK